MPGLRGRPAVITTISEFAVSSYRFDPMIRESYPSTGAASSRSSALPWGTPSMMSTNATSAYPFSAIRCAAVAPTVPDPTTVTLNLMISFSWNRSEAGDDVIGELRAGDLGGAFHLARQIIRDGAGQDRLLNGPDDRLRGLRPAEVF